LRNEKNSTDQLVLVASEATQLMKRLPTTPEQKMQVADAWDDAGDLLTARGLLESAVTEATEALQKATILHTLASIEFELQNYKAGGADYERAIHIVGTEMRGNIRLTFPAQDQLRWGNDELFQAGNCHGAKQHAQKAETLWSQLPNPSNARAGLGDDIRKFKADIAKNCK
jgi:tetratricopeptide (TPR) repeat protein